MIFIIAMLICEGDLKLVYFGRMEKGEWKMENGE